MFGRLRPAVHGSRVGHQAACALLGKTGTAKTAQGRKLIVKGPGNAGRGSAQAGHMNAENKKKGGAYGITLNSLLLQECIE